MRPSSQDREGHAELSGITWDHPRGRSPLVAACDELAAATGGAVRVSWQARSLHEFESLTLAELAARYDLLAIDHPFVGQASADGSLWPLEELLDTEFLAEVAADSVGPSAESYRWDGSTWALPMDAAAQVSAYRPDVVAQPPKTWDEVAALPRDVDYVLPANPVHLWSAFVTLSHQQGGGRGPVVDYPYSWWDDAGFDPSVCRPALERLADLLGRADPLSFDLDPIGVLDLMAAGGGPVYSPLVFGYSNYARPGYATHRIAFADAPAEHDGGPGTMLGGVGLAVSRRCRLAAAAAAVLMHILSAACQAGTYASAGGQPGLRSAWTSAPVNEACPDFFAATLNTLDHAVVRPRLPSYPEFQPRAGAVVHEGLRARSAATSIVSQLSARWRQSCRAHADVTGGKAPD